MPSRDGATRPSDVSPAGRKSAATSASDELRRAADLLRDVLLREDETEDDVLLGQVSQGLNEIIDRLHSLAGLQMMFEAWIQT